MGAEERAAIGSVGWFDLTVEDADAVRQFYQDVVGWTSSGFDMGGYDDFCMNEPETGKTVAGICHARGSNEGLPAQWIMYVTVRDVEASAERCRAAGGEVLTEIRDMGGHGRTCLIRDPAGAVAALFQPA